jgi:DNA-binding IclR family transcriptional regulator
MAVTTLSDAERKILAYLRDHRGYHSPYTIARDLTMNPKEVIQILEGLAARGLVRQSLANPVYGITDQGLAAIGEG